MNSETIQKQEVYGCTKLLKANDVAKLLNISTAYAYKLISTGELPSVHLGRSVRVRPQDVEEFILVNLSIASK